MRFAPGVRLTWRIYKFPLNLTFQNLEMLDLACDHFTTHKLRVDDGVESYSQSIGNGFRSNS